MPDFSGNYINGPFVSSFTSTNGTTYWYKDKYARELIAEIQSGTAYLGVTDTALTDGSTTNPISIAGASVTAVQGNIVNYGSKEFIFNGTVWQEFGDLSALGDLAFKNSASGSFKPSGSVSKPTFTGTQKTISVTGTPNGSVAISKGTGTANYTPTGSISAPTFTGTQKTVSVSGTPNGSVTIGTGTGTKNYTPAGTNSAPSFTGTSGSVSVSGTPNGSVTISKASSGTTNYTPAGTISTPTITVTPSTTTVNSITAVGTLPSLEMTVSDENLTFSWSAGTLPTKGSNTTVATGIQSATSSQPSFTGTAVRLTGSFSGSNTTFTGTFTPEGTVSAPSFTGTAVQLTGSFTGSSTTMSGSFTPEGTVSAPTFTGDGAELKATFTGSSTTMSGNYTPEGTISTPTFTGTNATVTVS